MRPGQNILGGAVGGGGGGLRCYWCNFAIGYSGRKYSDVDAIGLYLTPFHVLSDEKGDTAEL